jgi:hypothetical protein
VLEFDRRIFVSHVSKQPAPVEPHFAGGPGTAFALQKSREVGHFGPKLFGQAIHQFYHFFRCTHVSPRVIQINVSCFERKVKERKTLNIGALAFKVPNWHLEILFVSQSFDP